MNAAGQAEDIAEAELTQPGRHLRAAYAVVTLHDNVAGGRKVGRQRRGQLTRQARQRQQPRALDARRLPLILLAHIQKNVRRPRVTQALQLFDANFRQLI